MDPESHVGRRTSRARAGRSRRSVRGAGLVLLLGPLLGTNPLGSPSPLGPSSPVGGTSTSRTLDQLQRSLSRPAPVAPRSPLSRPDMMWVPDRYVVTPGVPQGLFVPGHWERQLSEREFYVEPLTACRAGTGDCRTIPGGVRPPVGSRIGP